MQPLTEMEHRVLCYMALGCCLTDVAAKLQVSLGSAHGALNRGKKKVGAKNLADVTRICMEKNMIVPGKSGTWTVTGESGEHQARD